MPSIGSTCRKSCGWSDSNVHSVLIPVDSCQNGFLRWMSVTTRMSWSPAGMATFMKTEAKMSCSSTSST